MHTVGPLGFTHQDRNELNWCRSPIASYPGKTRGFVVLTNLIDQEGILSKHPQIDMERDVKVENIRGGATTRSVRA